MFWFSKKDPSHPQNPPRPTKTPWSLRRPSSAFSELTSTEEKYINDLAQIVNGYIKEFLTPSHYIQVPNDLKANKERHIFGNIKDIHTWHNDTFMKLLKKCVKQPEKFGDRMIEVEEHMIMLYLEYCQMKPISDYIVTQHEQYFSKVQEKLGHNSNIKSFILLPIDRIFKYKPLFEAISNEIKNKGPEYEDALETAIEVIKRVCGAVNDAMVLNRLDNFPEDINLQGKLLLYGPLCCTKELGKFRRLSSVTKKLQVFILEQSIIFAKIIEVSKKFENQTYEYRHHIKVNQMELSDFENLETSFRLLCKGSTPVTYSCYAEDSNKTTVWINTIKRLLQYQIDFTNMIVNPK